jgi:hypothetical protein
MVPSHLDGVLSPPASVLVAMHRPQIRLWRGGKSIRLQRGEERRGERERRGEDPTSDLVGEEHACTHLGVLYHRYGGDEGVGGVGVSQRMTLSRF